jgi:hypothetical protein
VRNGGTPCETNYALKRNEAASLESLLNRKTQADKPFLGRHNGCSSEILIFVDGALAK